MKYLVILYIRESNKELCVRQCTAGVFPTGPPSLPFRSLNWISSDILTLMENHYLL